MRTTRTRRTVESYLTAHPRQTIYIQANSDAMEDKGIRSGDILAIDMALSNEPAPGDIVLLCMTDNSYVLTEWLSRRSPHERADDEETDEGYRRPVVIGVKTGMIRNLRPPRGARP